jgi:hypothetical protein
MSVSAPHSQVGLFDDLLCLHETLEIGRSLASEPDPDPVPAAPEPEPTPHALTLSAREVLSIPGVHLAQLPLATTLRLEGPAGRSWHVTTSQRRYAALREAREVVLTGRELGALAYAAENGRASPVWLAGWLDERLDRAWMPLDVETALDGCRDAQTPSHRWPLGRVLGAWGATLVRVAVGEEDWLT